jgi:conjugative transposon TraN protein
MKRNVVLMVMGLVNLVLISNSSAQVTRPAAPARWIEPLRLPVTYSKTSNLIFPYAIKSVDRGSAAIIVQKARGVNNILQVKAARKGFDETNLSVITADGRFYSFLVDYSPSPPELNIVFGGAGAKDSVMAITGAVNEETLDREAVEIVAAKTFLHVGKSSQQLRLGLAGIYLAGQTLWFHFRLRNRSEIDYNPSNTRFFLRDKKRSRRTAIREKELLPVYSSLQTVPGGRTESIAVGFAPFTVPHSELLIIQFVDAGGGRFIELKVKPRILLKARKFDAVVNRKKD